MESENKLIFIVAIEATKTQIKTAIEQEFKVKVKNVSTQIDARGRKKAYIKFAEETPAIDVATKLGLM
jgi:large subunit ribosomal protein L23